ncbi:hypothetical protein GCM10012283_23050 [Phycicoccus endophyticus]|nr:hypothetical protein GCM10012283_23050 [Phycicoccus endophyticus]
MQAPAAQAEAPSGAVLAGSAETAAAVTPGAPEAAESAPGGAAEAAATLTGEQEETTSPADGDQEQAAAERPSGRGSRRRQLEREGEVAADFLETLLDICDLDGDLDVDIDGDRAAVSIVDSDEGRVPRRLVGQDGAVLEAVQELTRLAVQSETGERSRLMLDIAGHRAARRAELVRIAREAIEEARRSEEPQSLEPMTAFERKVVHDEVLAAGLTSESAGSEPRRYVVITTSA